MQFLESESGEYASLTDPTHHSNSARFSKRCGICTAFVASFLVIGAIASGTVARGPSFLAADNSGEQWNWQSTPNDTFSSGSVPSGSAPGGSVPSGSTPGGSAPGGSGSAGSGAPGNTGGSNNPYAVGSKNFYKIDNTAKSATEAAALCASTGGMLARIDSAKDVASAKKECKQVGGCYLSLIRNPLSGVMIWGDGSPLIEDHFIKGTQSTAQTPCVEMVGQGQHFGKWRPIPCMGPSRNILCMNKGKMFYRVPGKVSSAAEYGALCRSSGGEMAVILNSEENRRAWVACGGKDSCWLGAGRDPVSYQFMWLDGTGVCFENWAPNEPSGRDNEGCALIDARGDWSDIPCVGKPLSVLCQSW